MGSLKVGDWAAVRLITCSVGMIAGLPNRDQSPNVGISGGRLKIPGRRRLQTRFRPLLKFSLDRCVIAEPGLTPLFEIGACDGPEVLGRENVVKSAGH